MRFAAFCCHSLLASVIFITGAAVADESDQRDVEVRLNSGFVVNNTNQRDVIWSGIVHVPNVAWLRLRFDEATLGAPPRGGRPTVLRITSLSDFATQTLNAVHLQQWQSTSAYFNGDRLAVEIIADPGAQPSRIVASRGWASPIVPVSWGRSICGETDDRVLSDDPRVGRIFPGVCSVWIINDDCNCLLTAGHCEEYLGVIEFNLPFSDPNGEPQHPGPEDQYAVDPASVQGDYTGIGGDWAYFGCFPNSNTGLTPYEAQGGYYVLAAEPPPATGQDMRLTGNGSVEPPIPPEWNRIQKTLVGPYVGYSGTTLEHRVDSSGGNSGSALVIEATGEAIGIHTHAGCTATGGTNKGTAINHPDLQWALAHPQGVCAPQCPADVNGDGAVDVLDLLAVLAAWGNTSGPEDINGDGLVDVLDLLELLAAWGPC